jgi:hypothetical protein
MTLSCSQQARALLVDLERADPMVSGMTQAARAAHGSCLL